MKFLDLLLKAIVNCTLLWLIGDGRTAAVQAERQHKVALLIIDVQDCFLPGGSLYVQNGEQVIPVINKIRKEQGSQFSAVFLSQDWHCSDHVSFASQHPGVDVNSVIDLTYNSDGELCYGTNVPYSYPHAVNCTGKEMVVSQFMWPDHCIQNVASGPTSAGFSPSLTMEPSDIVIRKGVECRVDSYSAFYDNGGFHQTELDSMLKERGINVVVVTGLALDYCVYFTSKDAHTLGYKVLTVTDASRGVASETTDAALKDMRDKGVELVTSTQLGNVLQNLTGTAARLTASSFVYLVLMVTLVVTSLSHQ